MKERTARNWGLGDETKGENGGRVKNSDVWNLSRIDLE